MARLAGAFRPCHGGGMQGRSHAMALVVVLLALVPTSARAQHHPRVASPFRLFLGFDGALWNMQNRDAALAEEYPYVMYRAPSGAVRVGWERFYTPRVALKVNGLIAVGQGRFPSAFRMGIATA
jgi:hypothetical protein